jgi:DNA gyrase subunit B
MCASLDEAVAGRCRRIEVTLRADCSATVADDGPGMSVELDKHGLPVAERLMTTLSACRAARQSVLVAQQFCGLGLAVVTALSEWCRLQIRRDGQTWIQTYSAGVPTSPLAVVGPTTATGTTLCFRPDPATFQVQAFDAADLHARFDAIRALLQAPVQIVLNDLR